jgi:hypothetical protein
VVEKGILLSRRALVAAAGSVLTLSFGGADRARAQNPPIENFPLPLRDPSSYRAYVPTASKTGPFYIYTCEFDSAWAILKTFGIDSTLEDQLSLIPIDYRLEPYYEWTDAGVFIYGGDITTAYSGDYTSNLLCRTTTPVMASIFEHYGLNTFRVRTRRRIEHHLRRGRPVLIKMPVDFKDWIPATWITPEGKRLSVVLSNDHAMIVIGYDDEFVVIRDVLGPTDTNWNRQYEIEVSWDRFLTCWASQGNDGLAVGPAAL